MAEDAPSHTDAALTAAPRSLRCRFESVRDSITEYCVPRGFERDTEPYRRARLITGFGLLGSIFGAVYATFYLLIGHVWGALVVIVCSIGVACVPLILRKTGSIRLPGNILTFILLLGFAGLCSIEGGIRGHAIAWLAALPLCALLLVEGPAAAGWCAVCVAVAAGFVILDLCGIRFPLLYPARWHSLVTAAGYLGLTVFMSVLGLIFEGGRHRAFSRMDRALGNLSEANARLKKLDGEKNEFLGVAAHDLKNPLNIILGFAELIATGRTSPQRVQEDAGYIIQASERMISIITQLLDVNAIEQGRFPLEITACDLGAISKQVTESYQNAAEKKGLSIFAAGPLQPAWITADPKATYRILDNLLSNAVKYSPPGGDIFVRMRNSPDGVIWEVQDQGAGMSAEDKARLFQKFAKLSARPTGGESSTGLGLSIVKMLANAMHGAIEVRSQRGEGSTFSLRLPSAEPAPESQR
ncbi:MAG TPA: HAMP domain-containing sensor histidine kinase [Chthoniobacteraceae bacterium]|nr:HAMP domain-containing sensor histidine kinase [Chthoniobacteraceae bacterium]